MGFSAGRTLGADERGETVGGMNGEQSPHTGVKEMCRISMDIMMCVRVFVLTFLLSSNPEPKAVWTTRGSSYGTSTPHVHFDSEEPDCARKRHEIWSEGTLDGTNEQVLNRSYARVQKVYRTNLFMERS